MTTRRVLAGTGLAMALLLAAVLVRGDTGALRVAGSLRAGVGSGLERSVG